MATHTEKQWQLSQSEVHDLRGLRAACEGGLHNVEKGLWSLDEFLAWYWKISRDHNEKQLKRFQEMKYGCDNRLGL